MNKYIKMLFLALIFLTLPAYFCIAIDCPDENPNDPEYVPWGSATFTYDFGQYGGGGSAGYQYRYDDGHFQVKIDWGTMQNGSEFLTDATMRNLLQEEIIKDQIDFQYYYHGYVDLFYVTECKATVGIVMNLDRTTQLVCCDPGASFAEELIEDYEEDHVIYKVIYITKQVTCGEKCCKRIYECETYKDVIRDMWFPSIIGYTTVSLSDCESTTNFIDCRTQQPIPCVDGSCD